MTTKTNSNDNTVGWDMASDVISMLGLSHEQC